MAKAGKRTKKGKQSAWVRFVKDNATTAKEAAKANGKDENAFAVLSGWWKEVSDDVKENYKNDLKFVHKIDLGTKSTKAAAKPSSEEKAAEPKADEEKAEEEAEK